MPSPLNSLSLTLTNLRALIAASATFQKWVNPDAPSVNSALSHIFLVGLPSPAQIDNSPDAPGYTPATIDKLRPFCLVNYHPRGGFDSEQIAMSTFLDCSQVLFSFEDAVPPESKLDYPSAVLTFLNNVGGVVQDMQANCGQNSLANLRRIRLDKPPTRADQTEVAARGDYHYILFTAEIGI